MDSPVTKYLEGKFIGRNDFSSSCFALILLSEFLALRSRCCVLDRQSSRTSCARKALFGLSASRSPAKESYQFRLVMDSISQCQLFLIVNRPVSELNPESGIRNPLSGNGGGGVGMAGQEHGEFVLYAQTNQKDCEQMSEWIVFFT